MGNVIYVNFIGRYRGRIIDTVGETIEDIIPPVTSSTLSQIEDKLVGSPILEEDKNETSIL